MAGLLDSFFGTPDQTQALGLLGARMMQGNTAQGFADASQYMGGAKERAMKEQYMQMQMNNLRSEAAARDVEAQQKQASLQRTQAIQQALPTLFQQPGMTGGAPAPQSQGGVPMFSQPMGVTPMQATPGGFDARRAALLGMDPDLIQKYAAIDNIGKQEVARTITVPGPNGEKMVQQMDKFGQPVGKPMSEHEAVQVLNLGNRQVGVIPRAGMSLPMGQSPDSVASNALSRRGQDMVDARSREANTAGKVPAGYRMAADGQGLEYIPGGPADPNAAKKAAPTEFQGKAAMFGNRAAEADKILGSLEGKYSPGAVNAKQALGGVWGVGGALESAGNAVLPAAGQQAEQAQRDFVNAVLRLESGAAIGKSEFENAAKQYFPQPFDSAAVKQQKAENRQRAIQGLLENARTASPQPAQGGASGGWSIQRVK